MQIELLGREQYGTRTIVPFLKIERVLPCSVCDALLKWSSFGGKNDKVITDIDKGVILRKNITHISGDATAPYGNSWHFLTGGDAIFRPPGTCNGAGNIWETRDYLVFQTHYVTHLDAMCHIRYSSHKGGLIYTA